MGMGPLLDHGLFYHSFDEAINCFMSQPPFLVGAMLPSRLKQGLSWIGPIPGGFQVILDGKEGPGGQGDPPELFPLADNVNDGLVPVGLEITDLETAQFNLS